jgi:hypothetical protein
MKRSAKELCAMLLKRSLKELNEEEIVVDYLEDLGIEVDLDTEQKDLCHMLLEKTMMKEKKKKIPMSPYINEILEKEKSETDVKEKKRMEREIERKRLKGQKALEEQSRVLPGCSLTEKEILPKGFYDLIVNPEIGIVKLNDGSEQYTAVVSVSNSLYNKIFLNIENPVLEIVTIKGEKIYAKLTEPHNEDTNLVFISPLVSLLLNINEREKAVLKLCKSLPEISKINFTYYGSKDELNKNLSQIIQKLPSVINAFSYLSLGLILVTDINGKQIQVRVDGLSDNKNKPIFAGLVPFGETDLPFDVEADM